MRGLHQGQAQRFGSKVGDHRRNSLDAQRGPTPRDLLDPLVRNPFPLGRSCPMFTQFGIVKDILEG